jgi:DNA-binding NtrC family response regulator
MTTILLVDDDPLQAHLVMSLLGRQSVAVRRVNDAGEALCLIEEPDFAGKLGLVISGHHTTGIGGPAFVAEVRSRMPAVPVLVLGMNGEVPANYADDHVVFLPRHLVWEQMAGLTSRMLAHARSQVA